MSMSAQGRQWAVAAVVSAVIVAVIAVQQCAHGSEHAAAPASPPAAAPVAPQGRAPREGSPASEPAAELAALATDDPVGALRLEGLVLDAHEQPVPGATVALDAAPSRAAVAGADGAFVFEGLVARSYTLTARAGAAGVAGPTRVPVTTKTELVVLHLRPGATLTATVVRPDASPIPDAHVELRSGGVIETATTGADGQAVFSAVVPGGYSVVAAAAGLAPVARPVRVAAAERVRLVLSAGAAVDGRVVDEAGAAVAGARVLAVAPGLPADPRRDGAVTDAAGAFHFAALAAGSLRFVASDATHATGTSALIVLDGATPRTGVEIRLPAGATVSGRVVDTDRQPVAGARVEVAAAPARTGGPRAGGPGAPRGPGEPARATFTDAHGEFALAGLARGPLLAVAWAEQGASAPMAVDATAGTVADVTLVLDRTAVIAGSVVDESGAPVEGATVRADPRDGERGPGAVLARGERAARSDSSGRFRITGLAPGGYTVRASRGPRMFGGGRRGRGAAEGVDVDAGATDVRVVLPAEGAITGRVALADGSAPPVYAVAVGPLQQSFVTPSFTVDELPPGDYTLTVRGPSFETHEQDVSVPAGKTVDVGTLTVAPGRRLGGIVVSGGTPVAGATVVAGTQILGTGTSTDSPLGDVAAGFGAGTKSDTTGSDGAFALSGFGEGDVTVIAELASVGRSPAVRVAEGDPGATQLVIALQAFGALSGTLHQDSGPAAGVLVTAQSTTAPGAMNAVSSGPDGAYRFDRLAPDTYKVSATIGQVRRGLHQYSQQVAVPPGGEAHVDLGITPGPITLVVTPAPAAGPLGAAVVWLTSAAITGATAHDVSLQLAAAGAGTSQVQVARGGAATFTDVGPGSATVCVVPLPAGLRGGAVMPYLAAHASRLPAFCVPVTVTPTPTSQDLSVPVQVPPMLGSAGSP